MPALGDRDCCWLCIGIFQVDLGVGSMMDIGSRFVLQTPGKHPKELTWGIMQCSCFTLDALLDAIAVLAGRKQSEECPPRH